MAKNVQRLFVAIETPPDIRAAMGELQEKLKAAGADVRWEHAEKFHLTLKFLGETTNDRSEQILATLPGVIGSFQNITIVYEGIGFFPPKGNPRVIWVGMNERGDSLENLHRTLEEQFASLGYPKEDRPFHPHVTLGRVRGVARIGALRRSMESLTFESHPVVITSIDLIKSTLKSDGSSYSTIARFPLQPGATR